MSRTKFFRDVRRALSLALESQARAITVGETLERAAEREWRAGSRRRFLGDAGRLAAAAAFTGFLLPWRKAFAAPARANASVAVVGAGLAGLACAYELKRAGITAEVYESSARSGGRCWSLRGHFPGQVAERGGELIDNLHKTMLGYAREFGLEIEDVNKTAGDPYYFVDGRLVPEAEMVAEFRVFVDAMRNDLRLSSGAPTANAYTPYDRQLDLISLEEYLDGGNAMGMPAGRLARETIRVAYVGEYGLEAGEQSCLNFLLFIHSDRRSKFTPWGVFSDERWHVTNGNDAIAQNLASRVGPIEHEMKLVRVRRTSGGRTELTFRQGSRTVTRVHDLVVLALPAPALRLVELDASLDLPPWKLEAIRRLSYGTNAKHMIGFRGVPWTEQDLNGGGFANLANVQLTWETNPTRATTEHAILTDYSGGLRGARLDPRRKDAEAERFLTDLERVIPGAKARATRATGGGYLSHLEHWPTHPHTLGSYTCYRPGDFTGICGNEGTPVGSLHFAGEHTDSFYSWQGFMEGACLSGLRAAAEILAKLK